MRVIALHLTDATSSKTWRVSHDLMAETGLSLGYSPNRNNPSLFKKILTLHADAPGECVAVDKDGNLVLSLSDNRRQEASAVNIRKARGRPGTQQIVANGDEIGKVSFQGFDGRQYAPLAELSGKRCFVVTLFFVLMKLKFGLMAATSSTGALGPARRYEHSNTEIQSLATGLRLMGTDTDLSLLLLLISNSTLQGN